MAKYGSWQLLDRLSNDEYLSLLPHLSLEDSFLTQIFLLHKKWIRMLDVNFQTLTVFCGCCEEQIGFDCVKNHLIETNHVKSLRSNVKQFYHPFYTYGKGSMKLAKGGHVSQKIRELALLEVNTQMKSFKKDFLLAKQFAELAQSKVRDQEGDRCLQLSLNANVDKPDHMFVMICLPFNDIPKLRFSNDNDDKWHSVFDYKYLTKTAHFYCNICGINCSGIESLNLHLNGYKHKLRQLGVSTLRHESNSLINKNCSFQFGDEFSYSVKKEANKYFDVSKYNEMDCNNSNLLSNISKEIGKKINALNEYVSKIFPNPEESDVVKTTNKETDHYENFDGVEYMGHLGVEYVLKIMKHDDDRDPKFECGLCEFLGDGRKMQRHLLNYDHKKKYLDLHYSDTIKKYENLLGHMKYMEFRAVISEIVDKIAVKVEKEHSRSLPYTVTLRDYNIRRPDVIAEVYALLHASQNRGPSFSNVFSRDDLKHLKNSAAALAENKTYKAIEHIIFTTPPNGKVYLNKLSHDPVVRLREYTAKINKTRNKCRDRSMSPSKNSATLRNSRSRSRNQDYRSRSRSPISLGCRSTVGEQSIWDIYRHKIAEAANEIEIDYDGYRKNPESHPLYEEEWNNFWQRRKRELDLKGINHRSYNFQPEWVHYFKQRIETLFGEELQRSQLNVRRKLEIPLDAEEDSQRSQMLNNNLDQGFKNKRIEESKELERYRNSFDYAERSEEMADGTKSELIIRDNHSNVVHVLRLMTALEEHLGSLGEKILDLLSSALQMEKNFQGNNVDFEANILTAANCQLLETAVEKLKGILYAGLLDDNKILSFNRVIQSTTSLLKYAEEMGWRQNVTHLGRKLHDRNYRNVTDDMNSIQSREDCLNHLTKEKPLSDTLMDLVNVTQSNKGHLNIVKERHTIPSVSHPHPIVEGSYLNPNLWASKGQPSHTGLASFDTKLTLDESSQIQKRNHNQFYHSEFEKLNKEADSGGNTLNNNNFKNNNETRSNMNTRINTGSNIESSINTNNGSSHQFRNVQFIPNLGQKNAMSQGGGGDNRNQNWSLWNNV